MNRIDRWSRIRIENTVDDEYRNRGKIALFSKVDCNVKLPKTSRITGNCDYVTSTYFGVKNVATAPADAVHMVPPHSLVVMVETMPSISSCTRQLLAQMLAMDNRDWQTPKSETL